MFEALKAATNRQDEMEFVMNKQPKCPHCGSVFDIDQNEAWHLYSDDDVDIEVECDSCQEVFEVKVHCQYSFSTDEQPRMDEEDEEL
mgnify:CR=1 FL=1